MILRARVAESVLWLGAVALLGACTSDNGGGGDEQGGLPNTAAPAGTNSFANSGAGTTGAGGTAGGMVASGPTGGIPIAGVIPPPPPPPEGGTVALPTGGGTPPPPPPPTGGTGIGGMGAGTGIAGTGASGTGASGTGASGTGASGTGASGTGASGTGAAGTGNPADDLDAVRQACVDYINMYRSTLGLAPYSRGTPAQESCSDDGSKSDSELYATTGQAHASAGSCSGLGAQNTCPGWPLRGGATLEATMKQCLDSMWNEGEPAQGVSACIQDRTGCFLDHGHWINMTSTSSTVVACGFYEMPNGSWWMNQNFGR